MFIFLLLRFSFCIGLKRKSSPHIAHPLLKFLSHNGARSPTPTPTQTLKLSKNWKIAGYVCVATETRLQMKPQSAAHTYLSFERGSASDACVTRVSTSPANCLPAIHLRGIVKCDHKHACSSSQRVANDSWECKQVCSLSLSLVHLHCCFALALILSEWHAHIAQTCSTRSLLK